MISGRLRQDLKSPVHRPPLLAVLSGLSLVLAGCAAEEARPPSAAVDYATRYDLAPALPDPAATSGVMAAPAASPFQVGLATWYGAALAGHKTASGERFDPGAMTAAHRTLPIGTWVVVRIRSTGREARVRINDRGPWGDARRVIDVSRAAADALGLTRLGVAQVEVWVVARPG